MLSHRDPFAQLSREFFGRHAEDPSTYVPRVDIFETQNAIEIEADVAGVKPGDIKLSVDNNVLTISGERVAVSRDDDTTVHRRERIVGRFTRTFALGERIDASLISAKQQDGVLRVTLPKAEALKPREITVAAA